VESRLETIEVPVTCTLLEELDPKAMFRKTSSWAMGDCRSKEDGRPGSIVRPDDLLGRSPFERASLEGAAHVGQIRSLRAVLLVVQVEEVTGVQVQASDQSERGSPHSGNLEDAVFVPYRQCWRSPYLAWAGAWAHMAAVVVTLTALLDARLGLERKNRECEGLGPRAFAFRLESDYRPVVR
jgi:hypothetical protein